MLRFRQMKSLQKFASVHANVHNHFNSERHLVDDRLTRPAARPHWPSGRTSWPEACRGKGRAASVGERFALD